MIRKKAGVNLKLKSWRWQGRQPRRRVVISKLLRSGTEDNVSAHTRRGEWTPVRMATSTQTLERERERMYKDE